MFMLQQIGIRISFVLLLLYYTILYIISATSRNKTGYLSSRLLLPICHTKSWGVSNLAYIFNIRTKMDDENYEGDKEIRL